MSKSNLLKLTKGKTTSLVITFFAIFFINKTELFSTCHWRTCPDYISTPPFSWYPNFYRPSGCGWGISHICWEPSWNFMILIVDILFWIVLNLIVFALISRSKTK